MKPLPLHEARAVVENWARWSVDDAPGERFVGAEALYRCPQRWHHDAPDIDRCPPVTREGPASLVERTMIRWGTSEAAHRARLAIRVQFVVLPDRVLADEPRDRWEAIRAGRARLSVGAYLVALGEGVVRLARDLGPHRRELAA